MTAEPTELHTERLLLRPYRLEDVEDVLTYAADPEWSRYLRDVPYPYGRRDAEQFLARVMLQEWEEAPDFAVVLDGHVVGGLTLRVRASDGIAELGYSLARPHWGKGLVPEAARAVIAYGFEALGLAKLYAHADARNERSWRVMEKLGMQREALLRSHILDRFGDRADQVVYGFLRGEWEAQRR